MHIRRVGIKIILKNKKRKKYTFYKLSFDNIRYQILFNLLLFQLAIHDNLRIKLYQISNLYRSKVVFIFFKSPQFHCKMFYLPIYSIPRNINRN